MKSVRVSLHSPEVVPLLTDLHREYELRYGAGSGDSAYDVDASEFEPPSGGFLVLLQEGQTVAGGGIRRLDAETCEIKRMWTNPLFRRRGHAITILHELEQLGRELGYQRVRLETGYAQPEALALYRRLGYTEIANYGIYENAFGFERMLSVPIVAKADSPPQISAN